MLVKVFGGDGAAGCWGVCVSLCVCSAAVRSSECQMVLVKLKKLSHSRLELRGVDHMLSGMTSLNSDRQNSPAPKATCCFDFYFFSHRPFQPLFQVQHVIRNSR